MTNYHLTKRTATKGIERGFRFFLVAFVLPLLLFSYPLLGQSTPSDFVVVLDPGHGGKDPGAISKGVKEKVINLAVALRVRDNIRKKYPKVKVIMTRSSDKFIPLIERANIANRNHADLFISIHANSADNSSAKGVETYVLGLKRTEDNLRVAMRENQVIELEENFEEVYHGFDPNSVESYIQFELMKDLNRDESIFAARCIQNNLKKLPLTDRDVRQDVFLVIREIAMPGILIELGFITNSSDRTYLKSSNGQQRLADAITKGFGEYYRKHTERVNGNSGSVPDKSPAIEVSSEEPDTTERSLKEEEEEEEEVKQRDTTTESQNSQSSSKKPKVTQGKEYRIQIASTSTKVKKKSAKDPWFRKLPIKITQEGNRYIYTVGSTHSLDEARRLQMKYKKWYKDAFIAVYEHGHRVSSIY